MFSPSIRACKKRSLISWSVLYGAIVISIVLYDGSLVTTAARSLSLINVRSVGARGDGQTDDGEAIRQALEMAVSNAVYFPRGIYLISRPLDLPVSPMRIYGEGAGSVLLERTQNLGIFNILPGSRGIEIDHLHFREIGTVHGRQLGRGVLYISPGGKPPAVTRLYVHDNLFDCASTSCIAATYLVNSKIQRNRFDNDGTGEHGVYLSSQGDYNSSDVVVEANIFHSSYRGREEQGAIEMAIQLRAAQNISIINNRISGWSNAILTVSEHGQLGAKPGVSGLTIRQNIIDSPAEDGFVNFAGTVKYAIVENNTISSCGRNGVRSNGPLEQSVFANNKILNNRESGIRVNFLSHSIFANNIVQDNGRSARDGSDLTAGIRLNQHNSDNLFIGNTSNISGPGATQQFGLSIGDSTDQVLNVSNCFERNTLSPNAKRDLDVIKLVSECDEMESPPLVLLTPSASGMATTRQVRIDNKNRVPLRILSVQSSGGSLIGSNCGELLAAASACSATLAVRGNPQAGSNISIVYQIGGPPRTLKVATRSK